MLKSYQHFPLTARTFVGGVGRGHCDPAIALGLLSQKPKRLFKKGTGKRKFIRENCYTERKVKTYKRFAQN